MQHEAHIDYEQFQAMAPEVYERLIGLGKVIDASGLDKKLTELVKVRVSLMNACAFCTALHLGIARKVGVEATKLDLVATWRDADVFSARERAALAWAEHLTLMPAAPIPDRAYEEMRGHFSEAEGVFLTVTVATINAWNRISGSLRFPISQAM